MLWANLFWLVFGLIIGAWIWGMILEERYKDKINSYTRQLKGFSSLVHLQEQRILDLTESADKLISNQDNNSVYTLKAVDPKTGKTIAFNSFSDYKSAKKAMKELMQTMKYDHYSIEKTNTIGPWTVTEEDK